jgi:predicted DNA-binding transcriptional regulator YafY
MRADRLLSIILLLQHHQQLTAKTLSDNLGVTERTIYRDIEALSMAGVPVYTRTGPDGGCFLDDQYRNSLSWFTGEELQTLLYTGSASPLSELGMQKTMDNAVLKLLTLLPNRYQQDAERMKQRLYLDPSGWYGTHDNHPTLPLLKDAVWGDFMIDCQYETWDGKQEQRTLVPYSLVYKSGRWYLVATRNTTQNMRTYRVSRFAEVRLRMAQFQRDPDFDIVSYWDEASAQFLQRLPSYPVTLRVKPNTLIYFRHMHTGRYDVLEENDNWWTISIHFTVFEEARTSVLGLGTDVEVVEPKELHYAVVEQAKAIIQKYGEIQ